MDGASLKGLYLALPVPYRQDMRIDYDLFAEDLRRSAALGPHGLYTTGSTGEFYALDLDEFKALVDAFLDGLKAVGLPGQVGCTWFDTRGVLQRVEHAVRGGAGMVQVALPGWMEMNNAEVDAFFADVQRAAGNAGIISYNTGRTKRVLRGRDFQRIRQHAPGLIGCKHTGTDILQVIDAILRVPTMAHFVGEHMIGPGLLVGATGSYSSLIYVFPPTITRLYDWAARGLWQPVRQLQARVNSFFLDLFDWASDLADPAYDKTMAAAAGYLKCPRTTRPPYRSVDDERFNALVRLIRDKYADLHDGAALDRMLTVGQ
jgi:4-hydroxy-tetrahydrodipicolinate synthase